VLLCDQIRKFLYRLARDDGPSGVATMHKQCALLRYGRAVKGMQTALTKGKPKEVLGACVLVFCFEILLDNRHGALTHAITKESNKPINQPSASHITVTDWLTSISLID
jgi:hypothetical protein